MAVAAALVVVVVVLVAVAAALVVVVVVLVAVVAAADGAGLLCQQIPGKGIALLHHGQELFAAELIPGGGDDGGGFVLLPEKGRRSLQPGLVQFLGAAEDNGPGVLDLVGVELAEILQIDLALGRVSHSHRAAQNHLRHMLRHALNGPDDVGELAHAGGLDEDAVRVKLVHHLFQRLAKVPHQGAADAPGVHLGDLHARVAEEPAVYANLAKLVFNEDDPLALQRLVQQFFNEGGLARAQEAGDYIYFCHGVTPLS